MKCEKSEDDWFVPNLESNWPTVKQRAVRGTDWDVGMQREVLFECLKIVCIFMGQIAVEFFFIYFY